MRTLLRLSTAIAGTCLMAATALAHVTLANKEAPVGAGYKAVFQVGHGCKGSPTVKLSVEMPAGAIAAKPQPKPGWHIETTKGPYDRPYRRFGSTVTEGVKVITWTGGNLPDDYYDEFVLIVHLDAGLVPGTMLYFPVTQTCEHGVDRWVEIPAADKTSRDYRAPAPAVKLLPAAEHGH
jgi:periplasmic copper chaperone A